MSEIRYLYTISILTILVKLIYFDIISFDELFPSSLFKPTISNERPYSSMYSSDGLKKITLPEIIHVYISCDRYELCCHRSIGNALSSIISQTVDLKYVTIFHTCSSSDLSIIAKFDVRNDRMDFKTRYCADGKFETCILESISNLRNTNYSFIISHTQLLEQMAVEKLFLSLSLRQPNVEMVTSLKFNRKSILYAKLDKRSLLMSSSLPNGRKSEPIPISPLLLSTVPFMDCKTKIDLWKAFLSLFVNKKARVVRLPLFIDVFETLVDSNNMPNSPLICHYLCLNPTYVNFILRRYNDQETDQDLFIPAFIRSEFSFHKLSAQADESETYLNYSELNYSSIPNLSTSNYSTSHKTILFVFPSLQVGGSESSILRLMRHFHLSGYHVTVVLTKDNWSIDEIGEVRTSHPWYNFALEITADIFDLTALAPFSRRFEIFQHLILNRDPNYIFISNSVWAYVHLSEIRALSRNGFIIDFTHLLDKNTGKGFPGLAVQFTDFIDLHLTASNMVRNFIYNELKTKFAKDTVKKVKACPVGSLYKPAQFGNDKDRSGDFQAEVNEELRRNIRERLGVPADAFVALFIGRLVKSKGIDVFLEIVESLPEVYFIIVGQNSAHISSDIETENLLVISASEEREEFLYIYYISSDVLLLPSINEGVSLVVYDTMMVQGAIPIVSNVGAQNELISDSETGFLIQHSRNVSEMSVRFKNLLSNILNIEKVMRAEILNRIRKNAYIKARYKYRPEMFLECVENSLRHSSTAKIHSLLEFSGKHSNENESKRMRFEKIETSLNKERNDGDMQRKSIIRQLHLSLTIGIKTYICDHISVHQLGSLVMSIRARHKNVRIIVANDGPIKIGNKSFVFNDRNVEELNLPIASGISFGRNAIVSATDTKYIAIFDDDHIFEHAHTNLGRVVSSIHRQKGFDLVGLRVRNLPGIEELETENIVIPRYVANITRILGRKIALCIWNENLGPGISTLSDPIPVDVVHNAFVAKTEMLRRNKWKSELHVNEHMTFFLDAMRKKLRVGYLPSEFIHHQSRRYSKCYLRMRFREEHYASFLDYDDSFIRNRTCGDIFSTNIARKIVMNQLQD